MTHSIHHRTITVGMRLRQPRWRAADEIAVTAVGETHLLGRDPGGFEDIWDLDDDWQEIA